MYNPRRCPKRSVTRRIDEVSKKIGYMFLKIVTLMTCTMTCYRMRRTTQPEAGTEYTDTYVPPKKALCPPDGMLKPPRNENMHKYHGNNKRKRFRNGARKTSRASFTKGRTVADRRKGGLRRLQRCRKCVRSGRNPTDSDWIPHNNSANCPFQTIVYDEDMNIVAGGNLIDMQFLVDDDSDPI